ncbi:hypothetical protein J0S82_008990 [Galemys pyrenaicus]|uniref:Uncharacterized protein n=1 Tax=Galemys pyrenaicus TaxID=202257 RepID=A0A8J6B523_GALPY|nr:hypothetical protein J0S82_008990 [Galemys pyrenaicus]
MKLLPIQMLGVNLKKQRSKEKGKGVVLVGLHLQIRNLENLQERRVELKLELEEQAVEELMGILNRMVKGNLSHYLKW